ncbi:3-phosphoserine/phosphohydroxythreonine transaminase [Burkholderia sp. Ac-20379]|uniref:3-phosphoserine/phosphohydroxythreonine transaminase n=1 Tax=Burkholderia sp. Ac-20379 TaxID=2703900 RepID=UPI00197D2B76|nr:3-phosphoserine/phosphohydroxythreonine transaminase [Burkholderia sp. Ac-20379]MBN3727787.1 3-phosphoserine/phosphohydroxythreonine transaminase [Burkholderia sp. Ac-20379]
MTNPNALNFSGGPGALPETVLAQTRDAIVALPDTGLSILGTSHRSEWFRALLLEAERNLRELLGLSDDYAVTFQQGGSSLQFAMIPMNFATPDHAPPEYVVSGYWSRRAARDAASVGPAEVVWDGEPRGFVDLPDLRALAPDPRAAYLHYVSNETVEGLQFDALDTELAVPVIADMSSDFLSAPLRTDRYAMLYAHAQKNLGPSGVTVAIVHRSLLARVPAGLPAMLDHRIHVAHGSNYNTPPVFAIYVLTLVSRWLRDEVGGLAAMGEINARKSARLFETFDALGDAVSLHAAPRWRSRMNVAFTFKDAWMDEAFVDYARRYGIVGLDGHRSIGGLRASLYNAVTEEAVETLCEALLTFGRTRL